MPLEETNTVLYWSLILLTFTFRKCLCNKPIRRKMRIWKGWAVVRRILVRALPTNRQSRLGLSGEASVSELAAVTRPAGFTGVKCQQIRLQCGGRCHSVSQPKQSHNFDWRMISKTLFPPSVPIKKTGCSTEKEKIRATSVLQGNAKIIQTERDKVMVHTG